MDKERLPGENNHHIVHYNRQWTEIVISKHGDLNIEDPSEAIKIGQELREQGSLIVPMIIEEHRELHKEVPPMPPFGALAINSVVREFTSKIRDPTIHPAKAIDHLLSSINHVSKRLLGEEDREAAELCLDSLERQRPIICGSVGSRPKNKKELRQRYRNRQRRSEKRNGRQVAYTGRR